MIDPRPPLPAAVPHHSTSLLLFHGFPRILPEVKGYGNLSIISR